MESVEIAEGEKAMTEGAAMGGELRILAKLVRKHGGIGRRIGLGGSCHPDAARGIGSKLHAPLGFTLANGVASTDDSKGRDRPDR